MTELDKIAQEARHLMEELGREHLGRTLQSCGWTFGFDRARRRLGACRWRRDGSGKRITLSRHHAVAGGWALMEDVCRHEIAHALDYETRGRSDHGPAWKRWARCCGADPTRLYDGEVALDETSRYVGTCPACGAEHPYHRRLKRARACRVCCKVHNGGRYSERYKLRLTERATGRVVQYG